VFYDKLNGFAIKIGKKEENDSVIKDIIIYETNNSYQDNFIVARDGIMRISENKRFMEFVLRDGWRYEERGNAASQSTDFIRLGFKEYKRQFDLSSFGLQQRTADSVNKNNARMLSMRQLNIAIDSMQRAALLVNGQTASEMMSSLHFTKYLDSAWTSSGSNAAIKNFDAAIPDSLQHTINQVVNNKLMSLKISNDIAVSQYRERLRDLRLHQIEWHRKIALSVACLVLFLIGAPLGSIIRKGGLGSPLVFAILFFMLFYFTGTTGEKFSKEGTLQPIVGMWMSTIFLVPVGVFLTYKAMRDSQLFNRDAYIKLIRKFKAVPGRKPGG
jgi:lipopolysaccharide export system permease protein